MGIEIEKKFTVKNLPEDLEKYPFHEIEQGYLNVHPAIRIRRQDDIYYMTYKTSRSFAEAEFIEAAQGEIGQTEYNLPLDKESYEHLSQKVDGNVIRKRRYLLPINEDAFDSEFVAGNPVLSKALEEKSIKIELDVFKAPFDGMIVAEVEFPDEASAAAYHMASWFLEDVTADPKYRNSVMSRMKL